MSWMDQIGKLLEQYGGPSQTAANEQIDQHFDQVAQAAPQQALAGGLADVFRAEETPPFPQMVGQLFGQSGPQERAGLLQQLFTDLAAAARVLGVREKGGPTTYASASELTPDAALGRLLAGEARAVQVRYQFAGQEWTDTILSGPGGFRVVRCRQA